MEPRLGIILFARMSSRRLPGKMLRPVGPTSLLERVVSRARLLEHPLLLATTSDPADDVLCEAAGRLGLEVFRGSVDDVLDRACRAARLAGFAAFARLCGDRPFLPLDDMREGLAIMRRGLAAGDACDLVTTALPRHAPAGLLTEVVRTESLERARMRAGTPADREHVTAALYADPGGYAIHPLPTPLHEFSDVRLAVDTEDDRVRLSRLIERHPDVGFPESLAARAARSID